ncbi:MAG: toll/interleukin-1 receptor domain-containing protein [Blastocatellia bacterium]
MDVREQPNVFLCHSSGDKPAVRELYARLRADGCNPWLDEKNLLPGHDWEHEIRRAIRQSDFVLVCLTRDSVDRFGYVQKEMGYVLDRALETPEGRIFIVPVRLEECPIPDRLGAWHYVDLYADDGYARLTQALGKAVNPDPPVPMSFRLALWGSALALSVLLAAHIPAFAGKTRLYAMGVALAAWLVVSLGPAPQWRRRARAAVRRLHAQVTPYRHLVNAALWLTLITAVCALGLIVWIIAARLQYARMITRALELETATDKTAIAERDDLIRRSFILLPQRREAQILLERNIWRLRNTEHADPFRQYVRGFVFHPEIVRTIDTAVAGPGLLSRLVFARQGNATRDNPVVWYASLLPEAEDDSRTDAGIEIQTRAIALLAGQPGAEAELYRAISQLRLDQFIFNKHKDDVGQAAQLWNAVMQDLVHLRNLVDRPEAYAEMAGLQVWQSACDAFARKALRTCQPANMQEAAAEAVRWYRRLLEARKQSVQAGAELLWQRPPDKLTLYHLFRTRGGEDLSGNDKATEDIRLLLGKCPLFSVLFREKILAGEGRLREREAWFRGSVLDAGIPAHIQNEMLNKGWRY